jgi:two-component system, sporulation sensor kinase A
MPDTSYPTSRDLLAPTERLEAFIKHNADAIWMIDMDDRIVQVNPAFETLFGWSSQEVLGGTLPIIPPFLQEESNLVHQAVKSGQSLAGYETKRLRKDGQLIYVSATLAPVRNVHGDVVGMSGTCRDITRNKRSEEELHQTKERLEAFIQHSADAIWMIDMDDKILQINPAFESLFGWSSQEVVGNKLPIIPDFLQEQIEQVHQLIKSGQSLSGYETQRLCKDGRLLHVSATLSPVRNTVGDVIGLSGTCRDISQNKKSEEMLIQSEKLNIAGQLAAGLAHEIRNPLTALMGFVQLLSASEGSPVKYLDVMASELNRIEMIVSELLMLAKPQSITVKRKHIVPILEDVLTLSDSQAHLHNVLVQTEFADDLPELNCDENHLKQVFINFIKNAIEAMVDGGTLRIEVTVNEDNLMCIRFQDEGPGIPKERLARLGEPFYTTKTKGTGLGLMVSKKIIENHNGSLTFSSTLGVGTQVDVYLPVTGVDESNDTLE